MVLGTFTAFGSDLVGVGAFDLSTATFDGVSAWKLWGKGAGKKMVCDEHSWQARVPFLMCLLDCAASAVDMVLEMMMQRSKRGGGKRPFRVRM